MTDHEILSDRYLGRLTTALLAASFICAALACIRMIATKASIFSYLIWNLFLAWTPYLAMVALCFVRRSTVGHKRLLGVLLFAIWLFLYPNAPYIFTDFIHLIRHEYPQGKPGTFFSGAILQWYDVVMKSSFAFTGHVIGLFSLYLLHRILRSSLGERSGWFIVIVSIFMSGFGVYLGRFVGLNSWDVIGKPSILLTEAGESLFDPKAMLFSLIYSLFILSGYIVLYYFNLPPSRDAADAT